MYSYCNNFHFQYLKRLENACICITSCQWSIGHMTCNNKCRVLCSELVEFTALPPVQWALSDLARWKKAYVLQGILKDQQWKKTFWEETRGYHACIGVDLHTYNIL